jgi:hypothetical protein
MAITLLKITKRRARRELLRTTFLISEEYIQHKETIPDGAVLPNQTWQHPEPETLRYCKLGEFDGDGRVDGIFRALLDLGANQMGGHIRILTPEKCRWLNGRIESWTDRHIREERGLERSRAAEQALRAPLYAYCPRCDEPTEQCKESAHRGENRCMTCNGGMGDTNRRYCNNCLDLPYREKRESAIGERVVYMGEEFPSE